MKKHRLLSLLTVAAMVAALVVLAIPAASAEAVVWNGKSGTSIAAGSGTADDPYLIKDPGELDYIAAATVGGEKFEGKYFRLEIDVDWGGREWTAIGTQSAPFGGVFDGNGKTVCNFTCTDVTVGLFGYATNAEIKNLKVDYATITTDTRYAGAIVGLLRGSKVSGCVAGENTVIAGASIMSNTAQIGGLFGLVNSSTVDSCAFYGKVEVPNVSGSSFVGGIAGVIGNESTVSNCINYGSVSSPNANITESSTFVGGIAGCIGSSSKVGTLEYCVNMGEVTCFEYAGGVIGRVHVAGSALNNCANLGTVKGGSGKGGAVIGQANKDLTATGNLGLQGSAENLCASVTEGVSFPVGSCSFGTEAEIKASDLYSKAENAVLSLPVFSVIVPSAPQTEPETTVPETTAKAPETEPQTTSPITTSAPETTAAPTEAAESSSAPDVTTAEPAKKSGCGSSVYAVTVILSLVAGAGLAVCRKERGDR